MNRIRLLAIAMALACALPAIAQETATAPPRHLPTVDEVAINCQCKIAVGLLQLSEKGTANLFHITISTQEMDTPNDSKNSGGRPKPSSCHPLISIPRRLT